MRYEVEFNFGYDVYVADADGKRMWQLAMGLISFDEAMSVIRNHAGRPVTILAIT